VTCVIARQAFEQCPCTRVVFEGVHVLTALLDEAISSLHHRGIAFSTIPTIVLAMTQWIAKATIDQLEDFEYISDVNKRLEISYNNPP
jgi:hypothetical protein